jgi:hypothetical protein
MRMPAGGDARRPVAPSSLSSAVQSATLPRNPTPAQTLSCCSESSTPQGRSKARDFDIRGKKYRSEPPSAQRRSHGGEQTTSVDCLLAQWNFAGHIVKAGGREHDTVKADR